MYPTHYVLCPVHVHADLEDHGCTQFILGTVPVGLLSLNKQFIVLAVVMNSSTIKWAEKGNLPFSSSFAQVYCACKRGERKNIKQNK